MAHDNYQSLISLSLDGLLAEDEQGALEKHLKSCAACTHAWEQMRLVDRMFKAQPEVAPSFDFKAHVMARVSGYEKRKHLYPWVTLALTTVLLITILSLLLPMLFFGLGLYRALFDVPVLGTWLTQLVSMRADLVAWLGTNGASAVRWLSAIPSDPVSLAAVVTALVAASSWIGMRVALKPVVEISTQSA
jgi:anti-sigma factor RsiW